MTPYEAQLRKSAQKVLDAILEELPSEARVRESLLAEYDRTDHDAAARDSFFVAVMRVYSLVRRAFVIVQQEPRNKDPERAVVDRDLLRQLAILVEAKAEEILDSAQLAHELDGIGRAQA